MSDAAHLRDQSLGELLKQLSEETSTLVKQELQLARAEAQDSAKRAGVGAGMLVGAAVGGLLMLGTLTALLVALLATAMAVWIAALIMTVVWAAVAVVLAVVGRNRLKQATPPVPQTVETVKEDVQWAKTRT